MLHDQLEELARKHGATSYRNRADTQNPAYGFTPAGLLNLLAEVTEKSCQQAIEAEREACAQIAQATVCDTHIPTGIKIYGTRAAASIRARSKP